MIVEGFFSNIRTANEAVGKLKSSGFDKAIVDINDHYIDDRNVKTNLPGTETSPSLSGLILKSDTHIVDRSKAPLAAASPMVSGMGYFEEIADINCKVSVESEEKDSDRARQIIKSMGGDIESPNVEIPKNLHNIDI
jgi:hypothetical protein